MTASRWLSTPLLSSWKTVITRSPSIRDPIRLKSGPPIVVIARAYGVVLETDGPGVVWDQFSMLGAFTRRMLNWDPQHIAGHIRHRDPDLIAFTYGGNDLRRVSNGRLTHARYVEEYTAVVERVRAGKPKAACLIIGITDRARSLNFEILPQHVETIIAAQRETAESAGCAFFDTYHAMGGGGSLKRWRRLDPPLAAPDLKHLTHLGRVRLGGWIYDALIAGYVSHRTSQPPSGGARAVDANPGSSSPTAGPTL